MALPLPASNDDQQKYTIAQRLAAQRALDMSPVMANRRNRETGAANDNTFANPINENYLRRADENDFTPSAGRTRNSTPQSPTNRQPTASNNNSSIANIAAAARSGNLSDRQRQTAIRALSAQEQALDKEADELISQLNNFRDARSGKFLAFLRPSLTTVIDRLVGHLKTRASNLTIRKQIAFLKGALIAIQTLLATMQGFKFIACFLDAAFISRISALQMIIKLAVTIVGAIIMLLLSFIYVPFLSLLFFINKFPLLRGDLTKEVVELITKLKDQKSRWEARVKKLEEIVARQDQRDRISQQRQALQQPQQRA